MPRRNAVRLTKTALDGLLLPASGNAFTWDEEIRGFGVRVFATGTRVFVYQCRVAGRTVRVKLGTYPAVTVEEARKLAKKAAGKVADGQSPKPKAVAVDGRTVGDLFPVFLEEAIEGKKKPRTVAEYRRIWEKHVRSTFARKLVTSVDSGAVARWHSEGREAKRQADASRIVLSGFFKWCELRGYRPRQTNPCTDVKPFESNRARQPKGKSLTAEEYRRLGAALEKALTAGILPAPKMRKQAKNVAKQKHRPKMADAPRKASPVIVAAVRFLALSGWRKLEALSLRWDAIDFTRGTATLQDTKTDRSVRPLDKAALELLQAQPRKGANPHVFPGAAAGSHLTEPKYAWTSIRHDAELSLRLHDLRHSFTTVASDDLGLHDRFIAGLIGHRLGGVTARYGETRETTLRQKADEIAGVIDGYMRGREAKVLPISGAKAAS